MKKKRKRKEHLDSITLALASMMVHAGCALRMIRVGRASADVERELVDGLNSVRDIVSGSSGRGKKKS